MPEKHTLMQLPEKLPRELTELARELKKEMQQ
jgi:hypothetical protein